MAGAPCLAFYACGLVFDAGVTASVMENQGFVDGINAYYMLQCATRGESISQMRRALAAGADPNFIDPEYSDHSAFHLAVLSCNPEAVAVLLSAGARVDITTVDGDTPLFLVLHFLNKSERDRRTIVNALISSGADVNARGHRRVSIQ